jgi:hypothetical protein
MSIWRLPHTVIIQLKRFSFRNFIWRDKIDKMVEFPTRFVLNFICFCFQKCTEIKISCIISKVGVMFDVGQNQHTLTKIKHPQVGAMYLVKGFDFLKQPYVHHIWSIHFDTNQACVIIWPRPRINNLLFTIFWSTNVLWRMYICIHKSLY